MTQAWLGLLGSIIVAALAFVFGRVNLNSSTRLQREEELRRRRVDTYAAFCVAVIEYRRAQLHRWFVGSDLSGAGAAVEEQRPDVADDVRRCRAAAWGKFYEVLMICNDAEVVSRAQRALSLTKDIKTAPDADAVNARSDDVHDAVREFAAYAGETVLTTQPAPAAPPGRALKAAPPAVRQGGVS